MSKIAISTKSMGGLKIEDLADGVAADDAATKGQVDTASTADRSRANHTGSQLAATISDFNTAVRLNTLGQMAQAAGDLSIGQKLTDVTDPSSAQHAATKAYVDATVATLSGGLVFKGAVRAVSTANISISSAPATVDGVTPTAGDAFLLTAQSTGAENGPYAWASAGTAMTRPANWNTTGEAVPGSLWVVQQGTYDNQLAILSNDSFTLATTTGTFVFLNPAGVADNDTGYTETCGTISAGAGWTITHSLGSKAVIVAVYRSASPYDEVEVYVTRDSTTVVTVTPDIAMSSGEYTAVVSRVV